MGKVRVDCFSISLDGFGAGPNQTLDNPLGERGMELHNWFFPTKTIQKNVFGNDGGSDFLLVCTSMSSAPSARTLAMRRVATSI